jgi:hypothetical protein
MRLSPKKIIVWPACGGDNFAKIRNIRSDSDQADEQTKPKYAQTPYAEN